MPLVSGQTVGRAYDINSSNIAVGSNGGGSGEFAVIYDGNSASPINTTTSGAA